MTDRDPVEHAVALRLAERPGGRHPAPEPPKGKEPVVRPAGADRPSDQVVASIGLPHHAPLRDIIENLRASADEVSAHGARAIALARELAAVGYAASTLGDGGSRGTDDTSSTERAAGLGGPLDAKPRPNRWRGVDARLARAYTTADRAAKDLKTLVADIVQHAEDLDPIPVGTGECQACGRFCRPDKDRPGNRLRSGLCPTDYRAYLRAGQPDRGYWIHQRRGDLTDENDVLHTPEPDHDIDLSSEVLTP